MGEAEEEKKQEMGEQKKPASGEERKQGEDPKVVTPPPPQEIVLKVFMHCEGCAKKVKRSLKGFPDIKSHKVVVKGEKADPATVMERVQRKSHRKAELISPAPEVKAEKPKPAEEEQKKKKEEVAVEVEGPQAVIVVLKVYMHCKACSLAIKRRILRIKGVESVETDLKSSQVTVVGVVKPAKLVEFIFRRTGKQAAIIKQEPKKEEEKGKEEDKKGAENEAAKKTEEGTGNESEKKADAGDRGDDESEKKKLIEVNRNEFQYYPAFYAPKYTMDHQFCGAVAPPPQLLSDENPNACSVM